MHGRAPVEAKAEGAGARSGAAEPMRRIVAASPLRARFFARLERGAHTTAAGFANEAATNAPALHTPACGEDRTDAEQARCIGTQNFQTNILSKEIFRILIQIKFRAQFELPCVLRRGHLRQQFVSDRSISDKTSVGESEKIFRRVVPVQRSYVRHGFAAPAHVYAGDEMLRAAPAMRGKG
jgi:hypothetical protein